MNFLTYLKSRISSARKYKYFILSVIVTSMLFLLSYGPRDLRYFFISLTFILVAFGVFFIQYPNANIRNYFMTLLLPLHLVLGAIFSIIYFPNLGLPIKIVFLISFGAIFYVIALINNIFLVIQDRNESIPLYRAAVTWNLIVVIVIAIPFFAGIFKTPLNTFIQNSFVAISSFLFALYIIWSFSFDKDSKKVGIGERVILSLFTGFCTFICGVSFSFIPTESFLRAVFVSCVLMFCLDYLQNHLKNSITKRILIEFFLISLIFLLILVIFTP